MPIAIFNAIPRQIAKGKKNESVIKAEANADMFYKLVISFNTSITEDAETFAKDKNIKILQSEVIYRLIEKYEKWVSDEKEAIKQKELDAIIKPFASVPIRTVSGSFGWTVNDLNGLSGL